MEHALTVQHTQDLKVMGHTVHQTNVNRKDKHSATTEHALDVLNTRESKTMERSVDQIDAARDRDFSEMEPVSNAQTLQEYQELDWIAFQISVLRLHSFKLMEPALLVSI